MVDRYVELSIKRENRGNESRRRVCDLRTVGETRNPMITWRLAVPGSPKVGKQDIKARGSVQPAQKDRGFNWI